MDRATAERIARLERKVMELEEALAAKDRGDTGVGIGVPSPREGRNGDIVIRKSGAYVLLCAKVDGRWVHTKLIKVGEN